MMIQEFTLGTRVNLDLPENFAVVQAIGGGDCFFDAVAQGLKQIKTEGDFSVKSLREVCKQFARGQLSLDKSWLKELLSRKNEPLNEYISRIEFTSSDIEQGSDTIKFLHLTSPIWGRAEIEGRILCKAYNVKLHVIKKHHVEGKEIWTNQMIDESSSRSIDDVNYNASNTVHITNTEQSHFDPILEETTRDNVFTPDKSKAYIDQILGPSFSDEDRSNRSELAAKLGHLPLALSQATAYIKKNKLSPAHYLALYEARKQSLLAGTMLSRETLQPDSTQMVVFITCDITMDKIREASPLAAHLLQSCAYLKNHDIPDFLLEKLTWDKSSNPQGETYEIARGTLNSYSMVGVDDQNHRISMHHVLQEAIRIKLESQGKNEVIIAHTAQLLQKCFPKGDTKEGYLKKIELLPHFEYLFPSLAIMYNKGFSHEMSFLQHLLCQTDTYLSLGELQKQNELLERLLPILGNYYGHYHFEVVHALVNLCGAYSSLEEPQKQKRLLEGALPILKNHYGPDHFEVARILANLGSAYGSLREPQKSKELIEHALPILENHYGRDHFQVAMPLVNLANVYGDLGEPQKSKELIERAFPILKNSNHPIDAQLKISLDKLTNLHSICKYGSLSMVKALIEEGADVLARNNHDTVLHQAVGSNNVDVINFILNKIKEKYPQNFSEHINAPDNEGDTPLMWAIQGGKSVTVQLLLKFGGVDLNLSNNDGETALHWAAKSCHQEVVQLLLDNHANPSIPDNNGKLPLDLAQENLTKNVENENAEINRVVNQLIHNMAAMPGHDGNFSGTSGSTPPSPSYLAIAHDPVDKPLF